ncbi:MAG: hypothetical protein MI746_08770 [Pseudomonadales bacterium]|nr:hypothetical protein [Pseudomonadales bacterium]
MNKPSILFAASCALFSTGLAAETSYEYAPVVESRPLYQIVEISEPYEQCWEEEVVIDRYPSRRGSNTPVLVSTIIGGAIGNAVGNGKSNKRVGAVVGAVLGHSIGRDIVRNGNRSAIREYETVQRCETAYEQREEERLVGYQVTYLYNGEERTIRTDSDPGDQIRLRVSVQPVL